MDTLNVRKKLNDSITEILRSAVVDDTTLSNGSSMGIPLMDISLVASRIHAVCDAAIELVMAQGEQSGIEKAIQKFRTELGHDEVHQ